VIFARAFGAGACYQLRKTCRFKGAVLADVEFAGRAAVGFMFARGAFGAGAGYQLL
jgi:hypothetical protein